MGDYDDYLLNDPIVGPILRRQQETQRRLEAVEEQNRRNVAAWYLKYYTEQVERLKAQNPQLDEGRLAAMMQQKAQQWQQFGPDLHDVYGLMTHDEAVRQAGEEGFQRGLEDGRRQGPSSRPQGMPEVTIPGQGGKDWDEITEAALQDEDVRRAIRGEQP
jgi:hypothetical protein